MEVFRRGSKVIFPHTCQQVRKVDTDRGWKTFEQTRSFCNMCWSGRPSRWMPPLVHIFWSWPISSIMYLKMATNAWPKSIRAGFLGINSLAWAARACTVRSQKIKSISSMQQRGHQTPCDVQRPVKLYVLAISWRPEEIWVSNVKPSLIWLRTESNGWSV